MVQDQFNDIFREPANDVLICSCALLGFAFKLPSWCTRHRHKVWLKFHAPLLIKGFRFFTKTNLPCMEWWLTDSWWGSLWSWPDCEGGWWIAVQPTIGGWIGGRCPNKNTVMLLLVCQPLGKDIPALSFYVISMTLSLWIQIGCDA